MVCILNGTVSRGCTVQLAKLYVMILTSMKHAYAKNVLYGWNTGLKMVTMSHTSARMEKRDYKINKLYKI